MARSKKHKSPKDPYERVCGNCKHYEPGDDSAGECYFNPPVVLCTEESTFTVRPPVEIDERACNFFDQRLQS